PAPPRRRLQPLHAALPIYDAAAGALVDPVALDERVLLAAQLPAVGAPLLTGALLLQATRHPHPLLVLPVPATGDEHETGARRHPPLARRPRLHALTKPAGR